MNESCASRTASRYVVWNVSKRERERAPIEMTVARKRGERRRVSSNERWFWSEGWSRPFEEKVRW